MSPDFKSTLHPLHLVSCILISHVRLSAVVSGGRGKRIPEPGQRRRVTGDCLVLTRLNLE